MGAFRLQRILIFLDPWQDLQGRGWQQIQGLYAIASGGFFRIRTSEIAFKNIHIFQNHTMIIFLQ